MTKTLGVTDWNIVQNNGARAAQVVPHVHFHIIPRPGDNNESKVPAIKNFSWQMFGRGQREDLDDDEGKLIAAEMRKQLKQEIEDLTKGVARETARTRRPSGRL